MGILARRIAVGQECPTYIGLSSATYPPRNQILSENPADKPIDNPLDPALSPTNHYDENLHLDFTTRVKRPDPKAIPEIIRTLLDDEAAK